MEICTIKVRGKTGVAHVTPATESSCCSLVSVCTEKGQATTTCSVGTEILTAAKLINRIYHNQQRE